MIIKLDDFTRENAIVVYKEKVYADVNHSFAYESALNSEGKSMNLDLEYKGVMKAERIVDEQIANKTIHTWNWFSMDDGEYLVCTTKEDFFKYYKLDSVQEYANKYNLQFGYNDGNTDIVLYCEE